VKDCANNHHPFIFNYPEPPMQNVFFAECARMKRVNINIIYINRY